MPDRAMAREDHDGRPAVIGQGDTDAFDPVLPEQPARVTFLGRAGRAQVGALLAPPGEGRVVVRWGGGPDA